MAFSPLGYSVILAILAEGARGDTRNQLSSALKLPKDEKVSREMYKNIMQRLKNTNEYKLNEPEFKNWFYVYKNYTVDEDYRKILEKFYLTEVRSVERYESHVLELTKKPDKEEKVEQIDPLPSVEIKDAIVSDILPSPKLNSKDVENFDQLQKDEPKKEEKPSKKEVDVANKDDEKIITFAMEDKPEKPAAELYDKQDLKPGKNIKEKIKLANTFGKKTQDGGDYEIMEAVEARNHARTAKALGGNGITNSLSANRVGSTGENIENFITY